MGVVESAKSFLGTPYMWGGNGKGGIDCSGLTQQAYKANGINIPRVAQDQYTLSRKITKDQLQPGDLVFMSNTGSTKNVTHVVMYIGNGQIIEARKKGTVVSISDLAGRSGIVGYGTYLPDDRGSTGGISEIVADTSFSDIPFIGDDIENLVSNITKFIFILLIAVLACVFIFKAFSE